MINVDDYQKQSIVVMADDLTGANEIGIILAECGRKAFILSRQLRKRDIESLVDHFDALVINVGSRDLDGKVAYERVKTLLSCSEKIREGLFYKKMDSTIRGNLVEETDAILDLKFVDAIFLVPALPKMQRVTVGGYHLVNQVPVGRTDYVRGVRSARMSYLPTLMGETSKYKVDQIPLQVVESGYKEVIKYTEACYKKGTRIMVCDACMDEDLRVIRDTILNVYLKVLPVGSAGLFRQFFSPSISFNTCPCLIVCGSLNEVTRAQAKKLVATKGAKNIELNLRQIFKNKNSELRRVVGGASSILNIGYDLVLSTPKNRYHRSSATELEEEMRIATEIDRFLSIAVRKIIERQKVSGLILTGGSTSSGVIHGLRATGVQIKKQLSSLIPLGTLRDGPFDGLSVVTKAGGFGEEDVLIRAVAYLRREEYRRKITSRWST